MGHYNLIKLNATSSTNDKVKTLIKSGKIGSGEILFGQNINIKEEGNIKINGPQLEVKTC